MDQDKIFSGITNNEEYCGQILNGNYSKELKSLIARNLRTFKEFENIGHPIIFYLAAWHEGEMKIWYEFVCRQFINLFGCPASQVAEEFRKSVIIRSKYKMHSDESNIYKEIINHNDLNNIRDKLREEGKNSGFVEAVYKIRLKNDNHIWLKDQALIETHDMDGICLSYGSLTPITTEMKAEEDRRKAVEELEAANAKLENINHQLKLAIVKAKEAEDERMFRERLQGVIEMAGAVCHELNQPMQSIFGYSELLLVSIPKGSETYRKISKILDQIERMGKITKKLMRITRYETREYISGKKIIDIDKSSTCI